MFDARMIDAGAPNRDVNARRPIKVRIASSQCDRRRCGSPWQRNPAVRGYPKQTIRFSLGNHAMTVEKPRIVLRECARKSCAHRQSGHPGASLGDPDGIVGGWERQPGKACRGVQIVEQTTQHLDGRRIHCGRRPNSNAKSRCLQRSRDLVKNARWNAHFADRSIGQARAQCGKECRYVPALPFDNHGRSRNWPIARGAYAINPALNRTAAVTLRRRRKQLRTAVPARLRRSRGRSRGACRRARALRWVSLSTRRTSA